ncbi:hypothetical protein GCM10027521_55610 [Amycolatopsis cihanbeyliensis]
MTAVTRAVRCGRRRVADAGKRRVILAHHADGEFIGTIACATKLSTGTVRHIRRFSAVTTGT